MLVNLLLIALHLFCHDVVMILEILERVVEVLAVLTFKLLLMAA